MKNTYKILILFIFLIALLSKENELAAQKWYGMPAGIDFSNSITTTDCCPEAKQKIDSIMNNAPFVFEGRMIRGGAEYGYKDDPLNHYKCYL